MKLKVKNFYKNKTILITGGTGTIGSALVLELLKYNCKVIRVFSNDENSLFDLSERIKISSRMFKDDFNEYMFKSKIRFFLGDIRDYKRCKEVTKEVDIVIHAAAIKHVNIAEYNPKEAKKTNVLGTKNVLTASITNKVSKFLLISTDKVVSPVNVMGRSKLKSEKIILNAQQNKIKSKTKISCVRFGNILGSRGSVVPKFINLIKNEKNIIVNNKDMARFVMTITECTKMILKSIYLTKGKEIFILKSMKCFRILDLANELIKFFKNEKSKVVVKNIVNNEKFYEELFNINELNYIFDENGFYVIKNKMNKDKNKIHKKLLTSRVSNFNFQKPKEIIFLLKKNNLIS